MTRPFLDRLGDWNPQLLRELKGRFKPIPVLATIAIAVIAQGLIIGTFLLQLPALPTPDDLRFTTYPEVELSSPYSRGQHPDIGYVRWIPPLSMGNNPPPVLPTTTNILPGDVVIAINGVTTPLDDGDSPLDDGDGPELDNLQTQIRGHHRRAPSHLSEINNWSESEVTLTLVRDGVGTFDVTLLRIVAANIRSHYCTQVQSDLDDEYTPSMPSCVFWPGTQTYQIDWFHWYADVFRLLSWSLLLSLLVFGIYNLASDLERERQTGTLNFLRLSPECSPRLFLGKILGVPVLAYVGAATVLPTQHWVGLKAGLPIETLLLWDVILLLGLGFWYTLSLLSSLVMPYQNGLQPWLWSGLAIVFALIPLATFNSNDLTILVWLITPATLLVYLYEVAVHPDASGVFVDMWLVSAMLGGSMLWWLGWFWLALNRRFTRPTATLLSKVQSYGLVLGVETTILVIVATVLPDIPNVWVPVLLLSNVILFYGLMVALAGQRQSLVDWARYHHQLTTALPSRSPRWRQQLNNLFIADHGPTIGAFGLNLAIAGVLLGGWQLWYSYHYHDGASDNFLSDTVTLHGFEILILHMLGAFGALMILVQLLLLYRTPQRTLWTAGAIAANFGLPLLVSVLLDSASPMAWPFIPWAWVTSLGEPINSAALSMGLLGQWVFILGGILSLQRILRQIGASELQHLIESRPESRALTDVGVTGGP